MQRLKFAGLLFVAMIIVFAGKAQELKWGPLPSAPANAEKPVWCVEFIKVNPGMLTPAMGYLDDQWIRLRREAKEQGAVVTYFRVADKNLGNNAWDIMLMTEYKNHATYNSRDKIFDAIRGRLTANTSSVIKGYRKEDLFESRKTRALDDFSDGGYPQLRLLSKD